MGVKMVVVDGVRYREEDAPKKKTTTAAPKTDEKSGEVKHKARRPASEATGGE